MRRSRNLLKDSKGAGGPSRLPTPERCSGANTFFQCCGSGSLSGLDPVNGVPGSVSASRLPFFLHFCCYSVFLVRDENFFSSNMSNWL
jgi:hypothetical protein